MKELDWEQQARAMALERDAAVSVQEDTLLVKQAMMERIKLLQARESKLYTALNRLRQRSDNLYCESLQNFRRTECLGWKAKVASGQYGEAEHKAHQKADTLMGQSQGGAEACRIIREALSAASLEWMERNPDKVESFMERVMAEPAPVERVKDYLCDATEAELREMLGDRFDVLASTTPSPAP